MGEDKKVNGRPTKYDDSMADRVYRLSLLGLRNEDLALAFGVHLSTIYEWMNVHPTFSDAIKRGREEADCYIAESLYKKAKGFSVPEEKVFQNGGEIVTHTTQKYFPPDTAAAFIWLKNRHPERWKDKKEEVTEATIKIDSEDKDL